MIQQPKFRGLKSDGEWKYGFYFFSTIWKKHVIITSLDGRDIFNFVSPESVGQFTGLLYSDGKEAYSGDLFKAIGDDFLYRIWQVKGGFAINIYKKCWATDVKNRIPDIFEPLADMQTSSWFTGNCVYVGNVIDNPELITFL